MYVCVCVCVYIYIYTHTHTHRYIYIYIYIYTHTQISTNYGLDGPGWNPDGDEIFRQSRPALGPTQPPVQWTPGLSRG